MQRAEAGAAALRARLAELREAAAPWRRRPLAHRVARLADALEAACAPGSSLRRTLEASLPDATGFSPETVREGLARGLAGWGGPALHELAARELGAALGATPARRATGFGTTTVLLAGALPTPTLPALLAPLVLGSAVLAKPSSHDPITAPAWAEALAAIDPEAGAALTVAVVPEDDSEARQALLEADCVVASGSDETVATLALRVRPPRRLVAYGHRMSFAALGPGALAGAPLERAAEALALDVALWDQLGCLSPLALFVQAPGGRVPEAVVEALAGALARAQERWPRGRVAPGSAAAVVQARDEAELRAAAGGGGAVLAGAGTSWTLVVETDARLRSAPLHRFLRVHPVADADALLAALRPAAPWLAAVGLAGFGPDAGALAARLAELGASRICPLGSMQSPPLGWCHDNRGVLVPLARLADVELGVDGP